MERVGFQIQVKPERLEEYKEIHANVWPELLAEIKAAGLRNYTLWMRPDGLQFGYVECDSWKDACDYLANSEVHTRWQEYMKDYLVTETNSDNGGQPVQMLTNSFFLE